MLTAREIADQVRRARQATWDRNGSATAIVTMDKLPADEEQAVRQAVTAAGYQGKELEDMVKHVAHLVVGQVEALADDQPATGAD